MVSEVGNYVSYFVENETLEMTRNFSFDNYLFYRFRLLHSQLQKLALILLSEHPFLKNNFENSVQM